MSVESAMYATLSMNYRVMPKSDQLPYALYRAEQVRELDRQAIERFAIPGRELMQRAGKAAFALAREAWPGVRQIAVLVGTGNNGGDGFVFALAAQEAGLSVTVLQLGDRAQINGDAKVFADQWAAADGAWEDFTALPDGVGLFVDAMLGTGLQRELKGVYLKAVEALNAQTKPVLALDIPTGLHSDTGVRLGAAVRADQTISFIGLKQGMFTADGVDLCGEIRFDALEVPAAVYASQILAARRTDMAKMARRFSPRARSAHKGHFGHVLIVGGDHGYGGAVRLAAEAAARCGAGLVSVATRERHVAGLLAARPELMVHAIDHSHALEPLLRQASVVVIGPGLSQSAWGREVFETVMAVNRPMVVDADALNLLSESAQRRDNWVLTPHPGEAARLLGVCNAMIGEDRFSCAAQLQQRYGGCVVLKGAGTLIESEGAAPPALCSGGNPGMASGGMGDVLSGIIGSLLAQGWSLDEAAELGVCLHAEAADRAAQDGERGLLAADLMPYLRALVNP